MTALPSVTQTPADSIVYRDIIANQFSYAMWDNYYIWNEWVLAVADPDTYTVSAEDTVNAEKFSSFVFSVKCTTVDEEDGCCLISESDGTVCLLRGSGASSM